MSALPQTIAGARVLELGGFVAAPFAGSVLVNLGAEVIKVESLRGDEARHFAKPNDFLGANVGKKSIAIDLKNPDGYAVFTRLLKSADALVQNASPAAARRMKVTYDDCTKHHATLSYVHISAFGSGPYEDRLATNPVIEAIAGTMSMTQRLPDGRPTRVGGPYFDQLTGTLAALAVVNQLANPALPRHARIGLFETALFMSRSQLVEPQLTGGEPNRQGVWSNPAYDTYPTADQEWIFVGAIHDVFWQRLCFALALDTASVNGLDTVVERIAQRDRVTDLLRTEFGRLDLAVALEKLQTAGVPCAPINDYADVLVDEHVRSDSKLVEVAYGTVSARVPAFPLEPDCRASQVRPRAPLLGEDTSAILASIGLGKDQEAELRESGVIADGSMVRL